MLSIKSDRRQPRAEPAFLKSIVFCQPLPEDAPRVAIVEAFVGKNGFKVQDNPQFRWEVKSTTTIEVSRTRLTVWHVGADNVPFCWVFFRDGVLRKVLASTEKLTFLDYRQLDDSWFLRFSGAICAIGNIELVKLID